MASENHRDVQRSPRVSIVAPILARHDAISCAALDTYSALCGRGGMAPSLFTYRSDFPEAPAKVISNVSDLLLDRNFRRSDVIIYHFGVYAPLFDAISVVGARARQIVRFHNITSLDCVVSEDHRWLVEQAWQQACLLKEVDLIWADSEVNARAAEVYGVDPVRVETIPLCVDFPPRSRLSDKPNDALNLLFVGRIVPSKGVCDLVDAAARLATRNRSFRLWIAGNTEWSEPSYIDKVKRKIMTLGLEGQVQFVGKVEDNELAELYRRAHCFVLPSYHEGFCKPVIEALRAGCVPVTYDAHNLAYIGGGYSRISPTGNSCLLASALIDVMEGLRKGEVRTNNNIYKVANYDYLVENYVNDFSQDGFAEKIVSSIDRIWEKNLRLMGTSKNFPDRAAAVS